MMLDEERVSLRKRVIDWLHLFYVLKMSKTFSPNNQSIDVRSSS